MGIQLDVLQVDRNWFSYEKSTVNTPKSKQKPPENPRLEQSCTRDTEPNSALDKSVRGL